VQRKVARAGDGFAQLVWRRFGGVVAAAGGGARVSGVPGLALGRRWCYFACRP